MIEKPTQTDELFAAILTSIIVGLSLLFFGKLGGFIFLCVFAIGAVITSRWITGHWPE
jgi:hypothetical protein